ncbi:CLUMA_CG003644, isoform A [Clunio marinus]|uniref:CLUMA_CG003644, isoform A n=1 Tax=Clunio marinus TaxID=568069 RepID=A0A1J1HUS2_9DIPT|nr:CLUMA_CG003644, isoform A [Clunio marinus]
MRFPEFHYKSPRACEVELDNISVSSSPTYNFDLSIFFYQTSYEKHLAENHARCYEKSIRKLQY